MQGLEPQYSGPKPDVLPLDDIPNYYSVKGHLLRALNRS
jgi:hypothetical protein